MRTIKGDLSDFGGLQTPAPRVQVFCYIPNINLGTEVDFMIDTGADGTCLNGGYAKGFERYMKKETLSSHSGIGGRCGYYKETAILIFTDTEGELLGFELELSIQRIPRRYIQRIGRRWLFFQPDLLALQTPCLLGRDVLLKWELLYNHQNQDVRLIAP